jgi:hypothetical protein
MPSSPLNPHVADVAPNEPALTAYDQEHLVTYLRLLHAEADTADWREVAQLVLHIDPSTEPDRARRAYDSHLARAMVQYGIGLIVQQWSPQDGHYPPTAYQSAFALCIALQAIALIWFAMPWLLTFVKDLSDSLARRKPGPDHRAGFTAIAGTVMEAHRPAEW